MGKMWFILRLCGWACYAIPLAMLLVRQYGAVCAMLIAVSLPFAAEIIRSMRSRNFVRIWRRGE